MENYILNNSNGKARVTTNGTKRILYSYDTKVAEYDTKTKEIKVFGYHSLTTGRHINEFFKMFGLPSMTKKELFKRFNLKK